MTDRHTQVMAALEFANEVRLHRSRLFHDLKAGKVTLAHVLDNEWARTATIYNTLRQMKQWGPARVRRLLTKVGVSENRKVCFLSERQKKMILELVDQ
jgi:hypothetical protein